MDWRWLYPKLRVSGLGFGWRFRVSGFRVSGLGFWWRFRVSGFRVSGFGFRLLVEAEVEISTEISKALGTAM